MADNNRDLSQPTTNCRHLQLMNDWLLNCCCWTSPAQWSLVPWDSWPLQSDGSGSLYTLAVAAGPVTWPWHGCRKRPCLLSLCICCRENVFTVPLPSNDCLYLFHYSGFQLSRHTIFFIFQPVCKCCGNAMLSTALYRSLLVMSWKDQGLQISIHIKQWNPNLRDLHFMFTCI